MVFLLGKPKAKRTEVVEGDKKKQLVKCSYCEKAFLYPCQMRSHLRREHTKSHKCDECSEAYENHQLLRKHKAKEHPTYKCGWPGCTYAHSRRSYISRHQMQAHCGENSVACSVAGCQVVVPYVQLASHMREEHGEEENCGDYECSHCGTKKPTRDQLRKHLYNCHGNGKKQISREKVYQCGREGCDKQFSTAGALEDHQNKHQDTRPYECGRCSRNYHSRADYAVHLRKYHATSIRDVEKSLLHLDETLGEAVVEFSEEIGEEFCSPNDVEENGESQQELVDVDNLFDF